MASPVNTTKGNQGSIKKLLKWPDGLIWDRSRANEWGRLLEHGVGLNRPQHERIEGSGTLFFVRKHTIPADRKVSYTNMICDIRPQKEETHHVRITAGGDRLEYPHDPSSQAVSMINAKIHINSTISDAHKGARYMVVDIKNIYLGTPMSYYQYIRVKPEDLPQEIWDDPRYDIHIESDGYIYLEIRKGMYGLKEAGILVFNQLVEKLAPFGYRPMKHTAGLWKHDTRKTTFALCVDDFGIKYFSNDDANHLLSALRSNYKVTVDWKGELYCGMHLAWNYANGYVDVSMPGYVSRALAKYNHPAPVKPQHAPHRWTAPTYGSQAPQIPIIPTDSPALAAKGTQRVQSIGGSFLYYDRGVDPCILPTLNEIQSEQAKPTESTNDKCDMLMDYLHTYPDAVIRFHASDMILKITSDAAYLVLPKAHSRAAVHYHLGWINNGRTNGPLEVLCQTIRNVVGSAAEAEVTGIFIGGTNAVPMRTALEELGHKQPATGTPFDTDKKTARGIITRTMRQRLSKAFDMRYWWIKDRIKQKQFNLLWSPGKGNLADYFTKHHPPWHHKKMRYRYLQKKTAHSALAVQSHPSCTRRGCVTSSGTPVPHRSTFRAHPVIDLPFDR